MNEFLAEIYNTRESIGAPKDNSDVEKLAEAQLLDETLRAEGIDIDKLPGETILKLAHQLLGADSALVKSAQAEAYQGKETPAEEAKEEEAKEEKGEEKPEGEKSASEETFEEKVAQADFLGRVMAHSYWNEKSTIEKNAAMPEAFKKQIKKGDKKEPPKGGKPPFLAKKASADDKARPSVIDILAEKRASEWATAHGLVKTEQPAKPTDEEKLAAAVDKRAFEMLTAAGIDVNAVEAAAQK